MLNFFRFEDEHSELSSSITSNLAHIFRSTLSSIQLGSDELLLMSVILEESHVIRLLLFWMEMRYSTKVEGTSFALGK